MARVFVVAGLAFGDEGKGTVVDHLAREHQAHTVVRYNGGAQAAHNVVTDDGRHHTFSQFGSGTFAGARTHLSRFMLVNPISFMAEGRHLLELGLADAFWGVTVEAGALVTNPFQIAMNRLRELARGASRHGSCGMGIGETRQDALEHPEMAITAGDLCHPTLLRTKLEDSRRRKLEEASALSLPGGLTKDRELWTLRDERVVGDCIEEFAIFARCVRIVDRGYLPHVLNNTGDVVIFEGAQGVLLDQDHGFQPHTTWSDTTFGNATLLLEDAHLAGVTRLDMHRIGVLRSYATRHGAGPFVTENPEAAPNDVHNRHGDWQGVFRVGHFDLVAARYAAEVLGGRLDSIAMTHMDQLRVPHMVCSSYGPPFADAISMSSVMRKLPKLLHLAEPIYETHADAESFLRRVESALRAPVTLTSHGPTAANKRTRAPLPLSRRGSDE